MRLTGFEIRDFKRLKLCAIPNLPERGVVPIVGKNGAGKSSIIDAFVAALGGKRGLPEEPIRRGAERASIVLRFDALEVERTITASGGGTLTVRGADGMPMRTPQEVLDRLVGSYGFDPMAFASATPAEQRKTLARVCGVDLDAHERARKGVYDERTFVGRQLAQAEAQLASMPIVSAPEKEESLEELLAQIGEAQRGNATVEAAQRRVVELEGHVTRWGDEIERLEQQLARARESLQEAASALTAARQEAVAAKARRVDLGPLNERARTIEETNRRVRQASDRRRKAEEVAELGRKRDGLSERIHAMDASLANAVAGSQLPVEGLAIADDGVTLNGVPFSQASSAEKLKVGFALALAEGKECRLVFCRLGSLCDEESLATLAQLADEHDALALVELVDDGERPGVVIEDGTIAGVRGDAVPAAE